jgi:hypothetical protein
MNGYPIDGVAILPGDNARPSALDSAIAARHE